MPTLVYLDKQVEIEGEVVLGRHSECTLKVDDPKSSRRHARVFKDAAGVCWVEDLDSANGTTLNGASFSGRRRLTHEDAIGIGKTRVVFHDPDAAASLEDPFAAADAAAERAKAKEREKDQQPRAERKAAKAAGTSLAGKLIAGYRLSKIIGRGGMGAVYRAKQLALDRDVAFKVLRIAAGADLPGFTSRFQQEARLAGSIQHEGVVQVHECGSDDGVLWYSMELVEGDTLESLLVRDGRIDPALALLVVERSALALHAAHERGIIHKDVKPGNIMLSSGGKIKVLDLGLAEVLHAGRKAEGGVTLGSPSYISPEQASGGSLDRRSDIYSLGCTVFHLLTGRPPYPGTDAASIVAAHRTHPVPSLRALVPDLPAKLDEVVQGMMSKNPEWRHASMQEVISELKPLREELQRRPPPAKPKPPAPAAQGGQAGSITERIVARQAAQQDRATQSLAMRLLMVVAVAIAVAFGINSPWFRRRVPDPVTPPVAVAPPVRPAVDPPRTPVVPVRPADPQADALGERWQQVRAQVDRDLVARFWGSAERQLNAFAGEAAVGEVADAVRLMQSKVQLDGESWYRSELAALPADDQPLSLSRSLSRLAVMRDVVISANRGDAEARYQECLARLLQRLQAAQRQARQALEAGKAASLPALALSLEPAFRDTPVAGLQRQFAALAQEAAASASLWKGSWGATRDAMRAAKGRDALAAGAALVLVGEVADGKQLLLGDPALAKGDLLRRREALLGREVAVLSFKDPNDLQFIETLDGELQFADGVLTSRAGESAGLACTVPVGGNSWEFSMILSAEGDGQAVVSCHQGGVSHLVIRLEAEAASIRVHAGDGWQEQSPQRPASTPLRLRCACRNGRLQILMNGQSQFECDAARIPVGSQLRLEVAGLSWKLDELQVVGGE